MSLQTSAAVSRPVVMIVDDDLAVRASLKFSLEIEGFAVRISATGAELLRDQDVALAACLLIDQKMPEMTGLDLVTALRARGVRTPAVLIVSDPTTVVRERAAEAAVAIIEKPLLENALIDRIRFELRATDLKEC